MSHLPISENDMFCGLSTYLERLYNDFGLIWGIHVTFVSTVFSTGLEVLLQPFFDLRRNNNIICMYQLADPRTADIDPFVVGPEDSG